ncbi:hypothetical protein TrST_g6839 [Triparma strigata]|uniref:Uncharacterized protein n=1 Tax=Triparma strigata TaxID=1606541 RepID=A0A9W6ZFQ6_9STRA|nr:hypothetical protein TrST_g6839 [Triparma strigata]
MFFLTTIADTLRITPGDFGTGDTTSIIAAINATYPEKVIMDVGLCIALYDVIRVGSSLIHAADGGAHFEVVFRVVVFKPFIGEVITGTVLNCTKEGIDVTLNFFSKIKIPYYNIFDPNHFVEGKRGEGKWVWDDHENDVEDNADVPDDSEELAIEKGDLISFAVESVHFTGKNYSVKGVHTLESTSDAKVGGVVGRKRSQSFDKGKSWEEGNITTDQSSTSTCEMHIIGSVKSDGLGKPEWWEPDEEEEEEEENMDET